MNTEYKLFLDDIRDIWQVYPDIADDRDWKKALDYNEFCKIITKYGMPYFISFDHDLGDKQYYGLYDNEKTGYDCAKWLVNYCIDNKLKLPKYKCHSANPVGRDNILGILDNYYLNQD